MSRFKPVSQTIAFTTAALLLAGPLLALAPAAEAQSGGVAPSFVKVVAGTGTAGSNESQLATPLALARDAEGNVFVADYGNYRVMKWAPGASAGEFASGSTSQPRDFRPAGIALDSSRNIYVADSLSHRVMKWAPSAQAWEPVAIASGSLKSPFGVLIDPQGRVIIVDTENSRVVTPDGNVLAGGVKGNGLDQLNQPRSIARDAGGNLFITDTSNHRVVKVKTDGTREIIGTGSPGAGLNQFNGPWGVAIDAEGNLLVGDSNNHRVVKWKPGAKEGEIIAGQSGRGGGLYQLNTPAGIAVDPAGNVLIADSGNHRVLMIPGVAWQQNPLVEGKTQTVTLRGYDFDPKSIREISWGLGVSAKDVKITPNRITAALTVAIGTAAGARDVTLTLADLRVVKCEKCLDVSVNWYEDADGDKFGDPAKGKAATEAPLGYVRDNTDCDDRDATIYPGSQKRVKQGDGNCDGVTDLFLPPSTSDLSPKTGAAGTKVTLTGSNYEHVKSLKVSGRTVDFTYDAAKGTLTFSALDFKAGKHSIRLDGPEGGEDVCCYTVELKPVPKVFDATIRIEGGEALTDSLIVGFRENATYDFDPGLDEDEPRLDEEEFVQIFALADPDQTETIRNYHPPEENSQWWIDIATRLSEATSFTVSWDPKVFEPFARDYEILLLDHGTIGPTPPASVPRIDMTKTESLTLRAPSGDSFHRLELLIHVKAPDLGLEAVFPETEWQGSPVKYTVAIKNWGTEASKSGKFLFIQNGFILGTEELPPIEPNAVFNKTVEFTRNVASTLDITHEVRHVWPAEVNTADNAIHGTIKILPVPVPPALDMGHDLFVVVKGPPTIKAGEEAVFLAEIHIGGGPKTVTIDWVIDGFSFLVKKAGLRAPLTTVEKRVNFSFAGTHEVGFALRDIPADASPGNTRATMKVTVLPPDATQAPAATPPPGNYSLNVRMGLPATSTVYAGEKVHIKAWVENLGKEAAPSGKAILLVDGKPVAEKALPSIPPTSGWPIPLAIDFGEIKFDQVGVHPVTMLVHGARAKVDTVLVDVPAMHPDLEVKATVTPTSQKIGDANFNGAPGAQVDYEVTVTNRGIVPLKQATLTTTGFGQTAHHSVPALAPGASTTLKGGRVGLETQTLVVGKTDFSFHVREAEPREVDFSNNLVTVPVTVAPLNKPAKQDGPVFTVGAIEGPSTLEIDAKTGIARAEYRANFTNTGNLPGQVRFGFLIDGAPSPHSIWYNTLNAGESFPWMEIAKFTRHGTYLITAVHGSATSTKTVTVLPAGGKAAPDCKPGATGSASSPGCLGMKGFADLEVKVQGPTEVKVGGPGELKITIRNIGSETVGGAQLIVAEGLGSYSYPLGAVHPLQPGESTTRDVVFSTYAPGTPEFQVSLEGVPLDSNLQNNRANHRVIITGEAPNKTPSPPENTYALNARMALPAETTIDAGQKLQMKAYVQNFGKTASPAAKAVLLVDGKPVKEAPLPAIPPTFGPFMHAIDFGEIAFMKAGTYPITIEILGAHALTDTVKVTVLAEYPDLDLKVKLDLASAKRSMIVGMEAVTFSFEATIANLGTRPSGEALLDAHVCASPSLLPPLIPPLAPGGGHTVNMEVVCLVEFYRQGATEAYFVVSNVLPAEVVTDNNRVTIPITIPPGSTSGAPDLAITKLDGPTKGKLGEAVVYKATVKNIGKAASTAAKLVLVVNGTVAHTLPLDAIAPGADVTKTFPAVTGTGPITEIRAEVRDVAPAETVTTNNVATTKLESPGVSVALLIATVALLAGGRRKRT